MDIYIKPVKKAQIKAKETAKLKDIMDTVAPPGMKSGIDDMIIMKKQPDKVLYLVSATDIVKRIMAKYPEVTINNLGEMDTVVEFESGKKQNPVIQWLKIVFVVCVLLTGASTAIMSFHSDAQMAKVFQNYNKIFFGEEEEKPLKLEIPYSIGLAVGIVVFFNHFAGKKVTRDPTPIEVEMSLYEADVNDTVIDNLNEKNNQSGKGGKV